jgi:CheY-like chemotaxis protein
MNKHECLVIDDIPSVQKILDGMVEALGFKPVNVTDSLEGLASFEQHPTPLVVAEAEMGGKINAQELTATIKCLSPQTVVVLVTDHEISIEEEKFSQADVILHKPFSLGSFQSALNQRVKN